MRSKPIWLVSKVEKQIDVLPACRRLLFPLLHAEQRRQLGSLEEHILEHSLSTSFRKCCCRCFRSMGFFQAAVAIWPYVPRHNIFPKLSNPSGSVFTFTLLGQWTLTCTTVLLSSWPCSRTIAGLTGETLGITSNVGLMLFTGVEEWIEPRTFE